MSNHTGPPKNKSWVANPAEKEGIAKMFTIALAGNANVGKSAIFNQLTGLIQETGNWSGKTVGFREGCLNHHGLRVKVVDLPGIYSFATYSPEEQVTREYVLIQHPDVVINVIDGTSLERNLYLTLQLHEMNIPMVIAFNFADIAKKKHLNINLKLLSKVLETPVIGTVAIKGIGVHELVDAALNIRNNKDAPVSPHILKYGLEIENRITNLSANLASGEIKFPLRWTAIKLLEGDPETVTALQNIVPSAIQIARQMVGEIAGIHGEESAVVIAAERYALAARIARQAGNHSAPETGLVSRLDTISLHPLGGYLLFFATMVGILIFISFFGGWLTDVITRFFEYLRPQTTSLLGDILWQGGVVGFYAALSVALGFILPFFLILGWLGESGYLPRIAFLMDKPAHSVGLHGQASLPFLMALGCNVPACLACRIMDNRRDRLIASFLSTLIPCSARTSVLLGLVGAFIGWQWAIALLAFQFLLVFLIGKTINRLSPSTSPGIIMEIPEYRLPALKVVWRQAWNKFKDFLIVGVPLIVAGSLVIESLEVFDLLKYLTQALTPLTVTWLGLPAFTGIVLIFGVLRKEANLALLISYAGGATIASLISPVQMVVFTLVIMLYVPCISTIAVLIKEHGLKITSAIAASEIGLALLVGGIAARLLPLIF